MSQHLYNIRGTNGSGKSYIIHRLIEMNDGGEAIESDLCTPHGRPYPGVYLEKWNLAIVGKYDNVCGGTDGIPRQDLVQALCQEFLAEGWNVVFEGLLCSHTFARYHRWFNWLSMHGPSGATVSGEAEPEIRVESHVLYLDTPKEVCVQRVRQRRRDKGKEDWATWDPGNVERDWDSVRRCAERMAEAHAENEACYHLHFLRHQEALSQFLRVLVQTSGGVDATRSHVQ